MKKRAHVIINGDVTGVSFRAWTVRNAQKLGLIGWVKNADFNQVEAVIEGEEEKVKEMIKLCHQGPQVAWVEKVEVKWEKVKGEFDGFEIRF